MVGRRDRQACSQVCRCLWLSMCRVRESGNFLRRLSCRHIMRRSAQAVHCGAVAAVSGPRPSRVHRPRAPRTVRSPCFSAARCAAASSTFAFHLLPQFAPTTCHPLSSDSATMRVATAVLLVVGLASSALSAPLCVPRGASPLRALNAPTHPTAPPARPPHP
jgi:hypothetical protein